MKQRIDANGKVIEARKEGIGAPKVSLNTQTTFYNASVACFGSDGGIEIHFSYYFSMFVLLFSAIIRFSNTGPSPSLQNWLVR